MLELQTGSFCGNPAVVGYAFRPVALRPCLSTGLPFHQKGLYQPLTYIQEHEVQHTL